MVSLRCSHTTTIPVTVLILSSVDIPPNQVNILDGTANDLLAECKAYEEKIKAHGGIELFLGGIGEDGHIAFNVRSTSYRLISRT
jgi:6-phosphogluconolactonase/glucosamine-6-phosphate isomerase/deaminase